MVRNWLPVFDIELALRNGMAINRPYWQCIYIQLVVCFFIRIGKTMQPTSVPTLRSLFNHVIATVHFLTDLSDSVPLSQYFLMRIKESFFPKVVSNEYNCLKYLKTIAVSSRLIYRVALDCVILVTHVNFGSPKSRESVCPALFL